MRYTEADAKELLPKYGISSANLCTGAISAYEEGYWKHISLSSAAVHLLKPEVLIITFNTQNAKTGTANTAALKECR